MKLKALKNIILPDKKEVKSGDIFEYKGDIKPLKGIVEAVPNKKIKKKEEVDAK